MAADAFDRFCRGPVALPCVEIEFMQLDDGFVSYSLDDFVAKIIQSLAFF